MTGSQRPVLSSDLAGAEFLRWYWLKDELIGFARSLGLRATGSKDLLTQRIAAALDGAPLEEPVRARAPGAAQLSGVLTGSTRIPDGQRCSRLVREWFTEQLGSPFRFDGPMREYFANADGTQTLQDALDHYRATRGQGSKSIGTQFEYNRFTRAWHAQHPNGSRDDLIAAWREYRTRPVEERGHI